MYGSNISEVEPGSRKKLHLLLDEIYSTDGIYEKLQEIAFSLGTISCHDKLAVLSDVLPDHPREAVSLCAKQKGGLTVTRFFTDGAGYKLFNRYCLIMPSKDIPSSSRLTTDSHGFNLGLMPAELRLKNFVSVDPQGITNYAQGVERALADVAAITGLDGLLPS